MGKKITAGAVVLLILIAAALYLYAAHLHLEGLKLDKDVKPLDVVTLAFTGIIAILLQFYILFSVDNERAEKDLLILNARDALDKLRSCRDTFHDCFEEKRMGPEDQRRIQTQLRSLNQALDALNVSLKKSRCSRFCGRCISLTLDALKYKAILTGGTFPSKPYPPQVYTAHQTAYRGMDEELQGLIFSINKS
jgi:hypothetical protein